MRPMRAVFHLLAILVKVVDPEDMRICRTLFSKVRMLQHRKDTNGKRIHSRLVYLRTASA